MISASSNSTSAPSSRFSNAKTTMTLMSFLLVIIFLVVMGIIMTTSLHQSLFCIPALIDPATTILAQHDQHDPLQSCNKSNLPTPNLDQFTTEQLEAELKRRLHPNKPNEQSENKITNDEDTLTNETVSIAHTDNAMTMRKWRQDLQYALNESVVANNSNEALKSILLNWTQPAFTVQPLQRCRYTILDFGANVGDSMRKFIDTYLPVFPPNSTRRILDISTGKIRLDKAYLDPSAPRRRRRGEGHNFEYRWLLHDWFYKCMAKLPEQVFPEDYCYYGIEGNPVFTERLQQQEIHVMNMKPRPIHHVHFLTEHVGAGQDGPTTLFLDTVNVKDNFWGSSLLRNHSDVLKSGGKGVTVQGVTLTTLLRQTVLPGGHVMIKIDIEGGEYQLLEEAINSNILCDLVKKEGVRVDMVTEFHRDFIVGSPEPRRRWKRYTRGNEKIKGCGVNYQIGDGG